MNILWFEQISKDDIEKVGGKGANLGELFRSKIPVPNGFVVTAEAYFRFIELAKLKPKMEQILADLSVDDTKALNHAAKKIQDLIMTAAMPKPLAADIKSAYKKLCDEAKNEKGHQEGKDFYVAVRSSATAEDLPGASFAGQQKTFLNISGADNVIKAVQKCYASLFEARAIFYRVTKSFDHFKVGLAAPVQLMIESDASGIMFTLNPISNDQTKIVIEAGFGLGEAIVSGSVTPDRYEVDKGSWDILEKEINKQPWMIVKIDKKDHHKRIAPDYQERQKITDQQIVELAKIGQKIEDHYGFPQDSEWAIENGKIFIVQTRPVTTMKKQQSNEATQQHNNIATDNRQQETGNSSAHQILKGIAASFGSASGPVKIIHSPKDIDQIMKGDVLVTEMTTPDFVPAMRRAAAIVTDTGGQTSHAAIVSRELGIPCVVGTGTATAKLKTGQEITIDGGKGLVFEGKIEIASKEEEPTKPDAEIRDSVPTTATKVYVNLAEKERAPEIAKMPVDGVGLLRAEFMIADIGEHPKEMIAAGRADEFVDKLSEGMRQFALAFSPRPVVYRATDFKTNEYKGLKGGENFEGEEANPMIGYRGAMRYVHDTDVFQLEIKAIKKVREKFGFKNLWLMIPFVRTLTEMQQIMTLLKTEGLPQTPDFKLWMMVEVPSAVILIDKFLDLGIDGVSIGSNDLTQLVLGADRDNAKIASEFDERNEAVVWAMKRVIRACRKRGISCSICGQAPSVYPEITELFVREGATSVSINPDVIIQTRKLIASIERRILLTEAIDN